MFKNMVLSSGKPEQNSIPAEAGGSSVDFNHSRAFADESQGPSGRQGSHHCCEQNSRRFTMTRSKKIEKPDAVGLPKIICLKDVAIGKGCKELPLAHGQADASVLTASTRGVDTEMHVRQRRLCPTAPHG